jgi:hypothetical protein
VPQTSWGDNFYLLRARSHFKNARRHQCALSSAGADAADFVRLRLWADNGECVRQVMHAQVYRLLYAAVLPPEINAAVSKN